MTNRDDILLPETLGSDVILLVALLKLSSVIGRPMRDGVAIPHGLSTNELRVLMCVGGEGPVAGHEISDLMSISPMNVSRALAELDDRGWISRVDNGDNRRRRPVQLNDDGWNALGATIPDVRRIAQHIFSTLRKSDRDRLLDLFNHIHERIDDWTAPAIAGSREENA